MDVALTIVTVVAIAVAVAALAGRWSMSAPLVLIVAGVIGSYVPFVPEVELTPDIVLLGLLPPLLYSAAINTSLLDFGANRRSIGLLSVGLVLFTTVGVAVVIHSLLDTSWPVAFALGAVVGPPDAVAAVAVARRIGLPRRVVTILEGESLVNDATAIVTLRTAIAAMGGTVTVWDAGASFIVSAAGGVLVGLVVVLVVGKIRLKIQDEVTDVAVSLLTPWLAYLPAEEISIPGVDGHPSGVLAVVTAGLLLGHKAPRIQSGTSRLFERTNWATVSFVLENAVFLLIGLQMRSIVESVEASDTNIGTVVAISFAVLATVMALRLVWVFPATYLPRLFPKVAAADPAPSWRTTFVVGWAGMRGVVTLAAVFLLPTDTPHRAALVLIAFVVTIGTLMIQGVTLPWVVRRLGVPGPDRHEDHLQEATVYQAVTAAGLRYLDDLPDAEASDRVIARLRERAGDRTNAVWERLGSIDTPTRQYTRVRSGMLDAERDELLRIRAEGLVDQAILTRVMNALDLEESILDRGFLDDTTVDREVDLRPTYDNEGACEHLAEACIVPDPLTPAGCAECLADGSAWVHLRLCMTCGHVGCCDSSEGKHATAHFHQTTHPVIRSFEPGEAWRWCYVDEATG